MTVRSIYRIPKCHTLTNLTLLFERLRSYGLQLKSTKCHLFRSSVPFLGHIVGRHGLECDPAKIEDVKSWPVPDGLKSVRQFLGFVGYYRRFIPSFADVATPLVTLTGKDVPFVWDSSCSTAFAALRAALMDAPILAFPTETGLYILDTDASNFGLGSVLSQVQNSQERVVAYCSRALRPSQKRYCITKREVLAAVAMCIQFRSYLRGARFTLRTDHKSLVWLHRFKDTEGMMSRWLHVPVLYCTPTWNRSRERRWPLTRSVLTMSTVHPPDCPPAVLLHDDADQPFDSVSTGSSEDADLVPVQSGEDWIARLDDDLSQPAAISGDSLMGGGEKHAPRTPLNVASSQQFVSRRQRYLVAQEKFTECPLTAIGPQSRPGTALLVLPRFIVWWSPGKDGDLGEAV